MVVFFSELALSLSPSHKPRSIFSLMFFRSLTSFAYSVIVILSCLFRLVFGSESERTKSILIGERCFLWIFFVKKKEYK